MTETSINNDKPENDTNGRFVETSSRKTRYSLKPFTHLLQDTDDSDDAGGSDLESGSGSDDDWVESKKRKRKSQSFNIAPVQTLKKKLAEKTKALRKSASKPSKPPEPVEMSSSQEFRVKAEIPIGRPQLKVETSEVKVEKTDLKVKTESIATADFEVKIKPLEPVNIKIKKSEVLEMEKPKNNEPVVVTYSTMKNSSNISPYLLASGPTNTATPFALDPAATPVPPTSPSQTPSAIPTLSSSPMTPVPTLTGTPTSVPVNPCIAPNTSLTPPVPRIRIRSNLASPAFRNSLTVPSGLPAPVIPSGPRPRLRTPTPRAPRARAPRTPQFHRSPVSPSLVNSVGRPRRPAPSPIPTAHSRPFGGIQSPAVSPRIPSNSPRTPNLKDSSSLKNISPTGAVIYSGSNSLTITPRKVVPERPPVQRKLFKNEIEGIIAVRHEGGVLKYVVNLANGTHMPLTEHQVTKLREQNGGRLPTKLKIPVPSDVAARIEPSYLIED